MHQAIRRAEERGRTELGWLDSRHSFSFGHYHDPRHQGFGPLRVLNDDRVAPGAGFAMRGHRDMEILSWVLDGALEHEDDLGHRTVLGAGGVQVMSAGTGIRHSERNASTSAPVRFLQIWIRPERAGLAPRHAERLLPPAALEGGLAAIAAGDGASGALPLGQDARVHAARLAAGRPVEHLLAADRIAWLQVACGAVALGGTTLGEGDGVGLRGPGPLRIEASGPAEILLIDMAEHA